ncbi:tetratricopeptide repeat protein [Vibrio cholerae]|uniref:tetratricopeptide repeat protein n=1 Tax=Vibrio cholerae TaxID=666 RepID=UPI00115B6BED|nr:tetratricopeptide repeat protein [Vibrio cholerae]TQP29480.1 tetratricopeptide repeat protein [Vibrio cholerae]TQQ72532.1 tetratricopeptide repeat protein [Vibrio cholerae]
MVKQWFVFIGVILLTACSSVSNELKTKEDLLVNLGESQQLIEFYKENIKDVHEYKVKLVNAYLDAKDTKSAELYANTYNSSDFNDPQYILSLARLNYEKGSFDKSSALLEQYRQEGGDNHEYYLMMGKILAQQKKYSVAIEHFEESRKQGVSDRDGLNNIAVVHLIQGNDAEAMDILYRLYSEAPQDEKIRSNLIVAAVNASRIDVALEVLKYNSTEEQARKQLAVLMKSSKPQKKRSEKMLANNAAAQPTSVVKSTQPVRAAETSTPVVVQPEPVAVKTPAVADPVMTIPITARATVTPSSKLDPNSLKPGAPSIFRIQVLATYKEIPSDYLKYLRTNYGKVYSYSHGLWKRYCIGEFNDLEEAKMFLESSNIKGAFVVDYTKKRYVEL